MRVALEREGKPSNVSSNRVVLEREGKRRASSSNAKVRKRRMIIMMSSSTLEDILPQIPRHPG